jgi:hypothetical protein
MEEQKERAAGRNGRFSRLFLLLLVPVVLSLLLHVEKSRRRGKILKAESQLVAMVSAHPIDKVKAERARFYETQYYLGYPSSISYAMANLIRRLDGVVRPLRLLDVQVDPELRDLKFKLTVGVAAAGPEAARRRFAVFFEKLQAFPEIIQASFYGNDLIDAGSRLYVFSISGQVEWQ